MAISTDPDFYKPWPSVPGTPVGSIPASPTSGIYYGWLTAMRVARGGTYVRRKAWTTKWLQWFGGLWWMREGTADPTVVEADEFTASEFLATDWTHYPLNADGSIDFDGAEPIDPGTSFPVTIEDPPPIGISDPITGGGSGGSGGSGSSPEEPDPDAPLQPFEGGGAPDSGAGDDGFTPTPPTPPTTPDDGGNDPIIPPGAGDPPPPGFVGDPGFTGDGGSGGGGTGGGGDGDSGGGLPPIGGGGGGGGVTPKPPKPPRAGITWPSLSFGEITDWTFGGGSPPWCYPEEGTREPQGVTFGGPITLSAADDEAAGLYIVSIHNAGNLIWSATMNPGESVDWMASFTGNPGSSSFGLTARAWGVTNQPDITASATTPTMAPWCGGGSSGGPVGEP